MPKKPCVRTLMGSQDVKDTKAIFKSVRQYLFQIYWSIWDKMSLKNSVFVVSEILRLFVNVLTPDEKYSPSLKTCV